MQRYQQLSGYDGMIVQKEKKHLYGTKEIKDETMFTRGETTMGTSLLQYLGACSWL